MKLFILLFVLSNVSWVNDVLAILISVSRSKESNVTTLRLNGISICSKQCWLVEASGGRGLIDLYFCFE